MRYEMKYVVETAYWRVPNEARAFENWLVGRPTPDERAAVLAEVRRERENWMPSTEAWNELQDLEPFVGQRVRIRVLDPILHMLEDEGPWPILADCRGIALLRHEGFLQAYLILDRIEEVPTAPRGLSNLSDAEVIGVKVAREIGLTEEELVALYGNKRDGYSSARFLDPKKMPGLTLAPIAELLKLATIPLKAGGPERHRRMRKGRIQVKPNKRRLNHMGGEWYFSP